MTLFITQLPRWLIKNLLLLAIFSLTGCRGEAGLTHGRLASPSGKVIEVELSISPEQHRIGLSGRKKGSLSSNQGMLFIYKSEAPRSFWMPDTYFDLDIIFMNKELVIKHIERNVPHHPGRKEPPAIARTKSIKSQYVLEMDGSSSLSKELKVGHQLKWMLSTPLQKIRSKTRP